MDRHAIHQFLVSSYWAQGIPFEILDKALDNSLCFGVFRGGKQVGFGRVITDSATFAYLADVYVLEAHRGLGLSKKLMSMIVAHPQLQGLRRMLLATRDAHHLYRQFEFVPVPNPESLMQRWDPQIYMKAAGKQDDIGLTAELKAR
ncbi:GNAT family N-acetyltransferase [Shewanella sp. GXUN23E]|uniref:GNAT family N-acetyltransferase n=1 Tax=Shewanella sp. GXUN23E TaxID=3422498 RepID=UPI003D7E66DF